MSIIMEEVPGALPSQIDAEPTLPLLRAIEARRYRDAVQADDAHAAAVKAGHAKADDAPRGPMIDLMYEIISEKIRQAGEDVHS